MKIKVLQEPTPLLSAPGTERSYFAWPSIARLGDGRLVMGASGFRKRHVCPFGKCVLSYSSDEGRSWSAATAVIDTVLDDRDAGLCAFGENGLMVTSFNNTVAFQQRRREADEEDLAYLASVTPAAEATALGATFRLSFDGGKEWSEIYKSPVTSPHGPCALRDGSLLWVGRPFSADDSPRKTERLEAWRVETDGKMKFVGAIDDVCLQGEKMLSCEPHALQLEDGVIICHFRVQEQTGDKNLFTLFETRSADGGITWDKPMQLLSDRCGAPAHLLRHSSGVILSVYGYRQDPFGIRVMLSRDGKAWEKDLVLWQGAYNWDVGYPATVELQNGSLYTVFYARMGVGQPAGIYGIRWQMEE